MSSNGVNVPTIKFELEGVRHTVMRCLADRQNDVEAMVNVGIDAAMQELPALIAVRARNAVVEAIDDAATKAIQSYFKSSEGYELIRKIVESKINP